MLKTPRTSGNANSASKTLGAAKAGKFALVEGLRLNQRSLAASALTQKRGLKRDAYREAITGMFRDKNSYGA